MKRGLLALAICAIFAPAVCADEVRLKDGSTVVGSIVGFADGSFKVETSYGFALIRKDRVAQIIPGDATTAAAAKAAPAKAPPPVAEAPKAPAAVLPATLPKPPAEPAPQPAVYSAIQPPVRPRAAAPAPKPVPPPAVTATA